MKIMEQVTITVTDYASCVTDYGREDMGKGNRFLKYWQSFLNIRRESKDEGKIAVWVLAFLALAVSLLNASILNAQTNFIPTEVFQLKWGNGESQVGLLKVPGRSYGPQSFAVDEGNKIYILDSANQRILIYDLSGNLFSSVPISQRADDLCLGIKSIYVLYSAEMKVVEYSLNGTIIATYPLIDTKSPIVGIHFTSEQGLFFETADGTSYPLIEKGVKVTLEAQNKRKIIGLNRNNDYFFLERKNLLQGIIRILDFEGKVKKELPVLKKEQNIESLTLIGTDNEKNIYLVVEESTNSFEVRRYLRKYNHEGVLLAEAIIPYSNYAYTFRDLRVTKTGKVYQLLPLKENAKVLIWIPDTTKATLFEESLYYFFSDTSLRHEDFLPGDSIDIVDTEQLDVEKAIFFYAASIAQNEIMSRAESYRTYYFYVSSSNITGGASCSDGTTVITPVTSPGYYTGVLYKWGGFSGLTGVTSCTNDIGYCYDEGLAAGKYAGDKHTTDWGSNCAVGVDCSGFVSRTWDLSTKQSTSTLPSYSCGLGSNEYLVAGDILNSTSVGHVMLFEKRESDGRFTVYEASAWDWKVSKRSYYAYEITSYLPYRYKNLTGVFQINDIIQANASGVRVRNCAGLSCTELCAVSTGDSGRVVGGPQEADGYTWWQITWNTGSCSGITGWSAGCYLQKSSGDTTPPTTPGSLSASAISSSQINLSWSASTDSGGSGLAGYKIERCTGSGCTSFSQIATTTSTSYSNTGLSASTTYTYRVRAYDNAGNNSGYSNTASATTQAPPDTTPPTTPGSLSASAVSSSQINLSWSASTDSGGSGLAGYKIERCTGSGCTSFSQIATTTSTSYSNTGLSASTTYTYRVRAYDNAGNNSGYSNTASATTQAPPDTTPPTPGTVTPSNTQYSNFVDSPFDLSTTFTDNESAVTSCEYTTNGSTWYSATVSGSIPNFTCTKTGITGTNGQVLTLNMRATSTGGTGTAAAVTRTVDASPPTTSDNSSSTWTSTSPVTVTLSPSDGTGSGVASTKYCVDTMNSCTPNTTGTSVSVSCASGSECVQYVRYFSTDNVGNQETTKSSNPIRQDLKPPVGTVSINSGATYTNSTSVTLTLSCTDSASGCSQMQFSNDNVTYSTPETYTTSKAWTLTSGDGTKTVYAKFKDTIGNWSSAYSDTIVLDASPPTGTISINSGATYTTSTSVTLSLTCSDASGCSEMQFSNDGSSYSTPEAYSTTKAWTLTSGDGTKTVYAKFKDTIGNWSSAYSDTIVLDSTAPVDGTLSAAPSNTQISLSWSGFSDTTSGIGSYKLVYSTSSTPSSCSVGTQIYSGTGTSYTHTSLTNGMTYYYRVCATDNANNTSTGATASATPYASYTLTVSRSGSGSGVVTSSPAGINCGSDCSEPYNYNTLVTLTATPDTGSAFAGWSGSCSGTNPTTQVTMNADKTCTATFTLNTYTLTVNKAGTGSGTVTSSPSGINCGSDCSENYSSGTTVTLTATASTGSTFTGWSGNCSGTNPTTQVTMDANKTCTATFTLQYTLNVNLNPSGAGTVTGTGINCPGDCTLPYDSGTIVTLTANPNGGYVFSNWTGCDSPAGNICTTTMNSNKTIVARFIIAGQPTSVTISGRQLLVNGNPFTIKGVGYSPVPIGVDPETTPPYGDYFTSGYSSIYDRDLPLLRQMGANTIRLWCWNNIADHLDFLDKAYNIGVNPIYVIAGFWINPGLDIDPVSPSNVRAQLKAEFREMVSIHKNHPAILMWSIGNELNADWMYGSNLNNLFSLINEMAEEAHLEDQSHPVTTPLADINFINTVSTYNSLVPSLDVWGANIYRGNTFGPLFNDYYSASTKPLVILEYGIDAYDNANCDEYENVGASRQAEYAKTLWNEIANNSDVCIGGSIMAYSDEWWKGYSTTPSGCPKGSTDFCPDNDPAYHSTCGYPASSHPDGYSNEEWWGIMRTKDNGPNPDIMEPRTVYCTLQATFSPVTFGDVPSGYWAEGFIKTLYCNGITGGCSASPLNYCPEDSVTRAQMAVFIIQSMVKAGLLPSDFTYSTNPYFTDVPSNYWAFKFIQKMAELGITGGCTATTYCPDDLVTRKEMAVFITRALNEAPAASCTGMFNDVSAGTVGDTFCRYIEKFATLGITSGCSSSPPLYCPNDSVTRAQMAVFLTAGFLD
jgi:uncharacterized repeat protein (TIGR02543 family)